MTRGGPPTQVAPLLAAAYKCNSGKTKNRAIPRNETKKNRFEFSGNHWTLVLEPESATLSPQTWGVSAVHSRWANSSKLKATSLAGVYIMFLQTQARVGTRDSSLCSRDDARLHDGKHKSSFLKDSRPNVLNRKSG